MCQDGPEVVVGSGVTSKDERRLLQWAAPLRAVSLFPLAQLSSDLQLASSSMPRPLKCRTGHQQTANCSLRSSSQHSTLRRIHTCTTAARRAVTLPIETKHRLTLGTNNHFLKNDRERAYCTIACPWLEADRRSTVSHMHEHDDNDSATATETPTRGPLILSTTTAAKLMRPTSIFMP